jgi:hypothetical protein
VTRPKKQVVCDDVFASDSSDSSPDEEEPQAPSPPKKKQKTTAGVDLPKKSAADVARQMLNERTMMLQQGVSEATMNKLLDLQASALAALNSE